MKIENWSVTLVGPIDPYKPPEAHKQAISGNVYGNPKFPEGCFVTTSSIKRVLSDGVITKSGSFYELGEIDPEYEKLYPNARERFFANAEIKPAMIGAHEFAAFCGRKPKDDDLERANCPKAGSIGHQQCGWCSVHLCPVFECGCQ